MLKKRIRKGIPEALRGRVWCHLAGSTQMLINNPGVYRDFLNSKTAPCEETIARDIGRTFPKHYLFNERSSLGQCALMNVLRAYSLHDPEVGYCQGMGFLSAMFLSYMPEEQSFWHLVACLNHKRYDLANLYRPRMPKVPELIFVFERLMEQLMPHVAAHLEAEGLHPTMYLTQWFITLFTYNFPFEFVTRVWDMFLYEGWKVIFRVALALMKVSQSAFTLLVVVVESSRWVTDVRAHTHPLGFLLTSLLRPPRDAAFDQVRRHYGVLPRIAEQGTSRLIAMEYRVQARSSEYEHQY